MTSGGSESFLGRVRSACGGGARGVELVGFQRRPALGRPVGQGLLRGEGRTLRRLQRVEGWVVDDLAALVGWD